MEETNGKNLRISSIYTEHTFLEVGLEGSCCIPLRFET